MEYAIAAGVTAIFILLYLFNKTKKREGFTSALGEEQFVLYAKSLALTLPAPRDGGSALSTSEFKSRLKKCLRAVKKAPQDDFFTIVKRLLDSEEKLLKSLLKEDFSSLQSLPYIDGKPRALILAEAMLSHSRYIFTEDRCAVIFNEANKARTLTYPEIASLEKIFRFALFEKLSFAAHRMVTIAKIKKRALRVSTKPNAYSESKLLKIMGKNKLFLRYCAKEMSYGSVAFDKIYFNITDEIYTVLNNVIDSLKNIDIFDFSTFYKPAEVLSHFENFSRASCECKSAFLKLLSQFSTDENIDELAYAIRLKKYVERGQLPPTGTASVNLSGKKIVCFKADNNMLQLAMALSSPTFMDLLFSPKKKRKSIIKNTNIKNTFAPKVELYSANFGISLVNDRLRIAPNFPECVKKAGLELEYGGVTHSINIEKGEDDSVSVNGTQLHGVADIMLGDIPLKIDCVSRSGKHNRA